MKSVDVVCFPKCFDVEFMLVLVMITILSPNLLPSKTRLCRLSTTNIDITNTSFHIRTTPLCLHVKSEVLFAPISRPFGWEIAEKTRYFWSTSSFPLYAPNIIHHNHKLTSADLPIHITQPTHPLVTSEKERKSHLSYWLTSIVQCCLFPSFTMTESPANTVDRVNTQGTTTKQKETIRGTSKLHHDIQMSSKHIIYQYWPSTSLTQIPLSQTFRRPEARLSTTFHCESWTSVPHTNALLTFYLHSPSINVIKKH